MSVAHLGDPGVVSVHIDPLLLLQRQAAVPDDRVEVTAVVQPNLTSGSIIHVLYMNYTCLLLDM